MSAISPPTPLHIRTNVRTLPTLRRRLIKAFFGVLLRVAPRVGAHLAARMFFTPVRSAPSGRMTEFLATGERFTIETGQGRIQGWLWGRGPSVYLVHGWSGRGGQLSAFVQPLVARGFRVITFDGPGHGESAGRRSSLIAFAEVLRLLTEKFGSPAGIVAHSLGGAAAAFAIHRGLFTPRLVLVGTPSDPSHYFGDFASHLGLTPSLTAWVKRDLERRMRFEWDELSFERIGPGRSTRLLVVHDRGDKEVPFGEGEAIARAWPGSSLLATSGLGHRRVLHDGFVVRETVDFLTIDQRIETPAASRP